MNTSAISAPDQEPLSIKDTVVSWETALQLRAMGFVQPAYYSYNRRSGYEGKGALFKLSYLPGNWEVVPAYQLHELLTGLVASRQTGEFINIRLNIAAVSMIGLTNEPICSLNYGPMGVNGLPDNWAEGLAQLIVQTYQRRQALDPRPGSPAD